MDNKNYDNTKNNLTKFDLWGTVVVKLVLVLIIFFPYYENTR